MGNNGHSFAVDRTTSKIQGSSGNIADVNTDGQFHVVQEGKVDDGNSTNTPLLADAIFTGVSIETLSFAVINVAVYTDKDSAVDGLCIEFSVDNINWDHVEAFTVPALDGVTYSFQPIAKHMRIVYTNGVEDQGVFRLQTQLKKTYIKPSSHRIQDPITNDDDAELVKSVLTGLNPAGDFINFTSTMRGNFKNSIEEIEPETIANFDTDLAIARGVVPDILSDSKFGRSPSGVQTTITDIWDRADASTTQQLWIPPTQARIHALVSAVDADSDVGGSVVQGQGGRTIKIFGLVDWDTVEISETVILDGTNPVSTVNSYVIIYRMIMVTWGTSGPNVGIITATAAVDGTVTAQINATKGQTNMAIWAAPSTQTAYIDSYYAVMHEAATPATAVAMDVAFLLNPTPDILPNIFIEKYPTGVSNTGTSYVLHDFKEYVVIPGPFIVKIQALASDADIDASAGFDYKLVGNG